MGTGAPDEDDCSWLPGILADIARVIGVDAALKIAHVKGGGRTSFPQRVTDDHWLVDLIGREKAQALCANFGSKGEIIQIPRGLNQLHKRRFYELRAQGYSIETAARRCGAHLRTGHRWDKDKSARREAVKRVGRAASAQLDLVDMIEQQQLEYRALKR